MWLFSRHVNLVLNFAAMSAKIHIAILWHMHQPPYQDPRSGEFVLPWTYFHGTKDYYDMGAVLGRHPKMRAVVNFTPALLEQLSAYSTGTTPDQTLVVMEKEPSALSRTEREYLLRTCLAVNHETMTVRFPRFKQLHDFISGYGGRDRAVDRLTNQDFLDLVTMYLLVWCGPTLSVRPDIQTLKARGGNYTQQEKLTVLNAGREFIAQTVPLYRDLESRGVVEISTTPFNHPIAPLLCTSHAGVEAAYDIRLPHVRFADERELDRQISAGIEQFKHDFGHPPTGMWPAEGAVSQIAVSHFESAGIRWLATDEEILRRSLGGSASARERLLPHRWGDVNIFFRDHFLSDQIGFVYSRWPRQQAVDHFMSELRRRADMAEDERSIVVVALDGENAWEFYRDGGYPFLDALYGAIEQADFVEPVTFKEYLDKYGPADPLDTLATGSWIDGNLNTWIGDPIKNKAWSQLATALAIVRKTPAKDPETAARVDKLLMRAEASDWFWWFGAGHDSAHEREFDYLFRSNLQALYDIIGVLAPDGLDRALDDGAQRPAQIRLPTALIQPHITGRLDGYYKWVGAGSSMHAQGSIHRLEPVVSSIHFGYDRGRFYLRCDGYAPMTRFLRENAWIKVRFLCPEDVTAEIRSNGDGNVLVEQTGRENPAGPFAQAECAVDSILELSLPWSFFSVANNNPKLPFKLEFSLSLGHADLEEERFPWDSTIEIEVDPEQIDLHNWFV